MKVDTKLIILVLIPVAGIFLCMASSLLVRGPVPYSPSQPEFLGVVDQLSLFTLTGDEGTGAANMRDVFRHEWTATSLPAIPDTEHTAQVRPAPRVTMVVDAGRDSFCIVNGKKMRVGESAGDFRVVAIGKDQVTITYHNGTRETHHVKAF
ncbi:MAG TPA: hypothetical protein PLR71_13330 [Deltaproteobacteria bacterium]|nr:hypothetical protein [Deltaproteobacteria bacterium]HQI82524.1 hypothetical protein [Deltaproteobacteria bacterium]